MSLAVNPSFMSFCSDETSQSEQVHVAAQRGLRHTKRLGYQRHAHTEFRGVSGPLIAKMPFGM